MAKRKDATKLFVVGTSRGGRSRATLLAQMARDLERQQAMGARIKALRESRPDLTQPKIADYVGVGLRAYQFWEAGDTGIAHDNVVKLAEMFGVSTSYIYEGDEPDVLDTNQLDRVEAKLDELLALVKQRLDPVGLGVLGDLGAQEPQSPAAQEHAATRSRRRRAS